MAEKPDREGLDIDSLAHALMEMTRAAQLMADAADALRSDLEAKGWSPTAAEAAALVWLQARYAT